jgi:hypothetical protein
MAARGLQSLTTGTLAVQNTNACGDSQPGTGEKSNVLYCDVIPASGRQVFQLFVG